MLKRQIALDTETTGINKFNTHYIGHKIIEIGAIEIINRKITNNYFHKYINPNREIDLEAYKIHNISFNFLKKKPTFNEIVNSFLEFIKNSDLIIHNAKFDIGFINNELKMINYDIKIENICNIIDSLEIARKIFPCKKNNLNDLCTRLSININRKSHSAILDAKILAKLYLKLTSKQINLNFNNRIILDNIKNKSNIKNNNILFANKKDIKHHNIFLKFISKKYLNKV